MSYEIYDTQTLFNPEGEVMPLKHIKSTIELGLTSITLKNKTHLVTIAYDPSKSSADKSLEFSIEKYFQIHKDILFTFSGITNDGYLLADYLVRKNISEQVLKNRKLHPKCLDEFQIHTSRKITGRRGRLFGCEAVIMGNFNKEGSKELNIYEMSYTGVVSEANGVCIGNRSQSCKTILENENFINTEGVNVLLKLAEKAMKNAYSNNIKLSDVEVYIMESGGKFEKIDNFESVLNN